MTRPCSLLQLSKHHRNHSMRKYIICLLSALVLLLLPAPLGAQTDSLSAGFIERREDSTTPDSLGASEHQRLAQLAFERKDYAEALRHYEHVFITYPTARTYYNMALCYSKQERMAEAILHYERALLVDPTMPEARHNLRLAYASTQDALSDGRSLRFVDDLCYSLNTRSWGYVALLLFALVVGLFLFFRFAPRITWRRVAFYAMLALGACWLFALAMLAHQGYYQDVARSRAIIKDQCSLIPKTQELGAAPISLHEGTAVFLDGAQTAEGLQPVSLGDGRHGYLAPDAFYLVVEAPTEG